jgi:RND family efflux transporter MFP subunit
MSSANTGKTGDALATLRISRPAERRRPSLFARLFKLVVVLGLFALVGVGGFVAAQRYGLLANKAEWIPEAIRARPEVRTAKVVVEVGRSADAVVVASGYLESFRQANIGARAAGRIESVNVEEGSRVEVGQVIAVLDHKDIDAALAAAQAAVVQAKAQLEEQKVEVARHEKDLKRNENLRKSNALSEAEYDKTFFAHQSAVAKVETLRAAVALAEARVQESEQHRENMIVRAPFTGTVISKDAEVGESILPGGMGEASGRGSVVTIADLDRLEVDCDVKEDYIGRLTTGYPAEVAVGAVPDRRYNARVRKVIPMGDRARATVKVKVEILDADERLFPEMSATVYFLPKPGATPEAVRPKRLFCDSEAIVARDGEQFVWTVDDQLRVERRAVTAGNERDGRTEILEGLAGGERIVVRPPDDLEPGQTVKLRE